MSGKPAARIGDKIACPVPQATPAALPHAPPPGLPIVVTGAPTVKIGGEPAARMGDQSVCPAPVPTPNPIPRGAFPVPIENMPAARMTDQGTHPGSVISPPCCPTVLIGLAGTAGNVMAGTAMCQAAVSGRRSSNPQQQTFENCGVESSRQVINQANGSNLQEEGLLTSAINNGNADGTVGGPLQPTDGGTGAVDRQNILASNGVTSTVVQTTSDNLGLAMSQSRGVIVNLDAAFLWPTTSPGSAAPVGSFHAVTVTGAQYDDAGNLTNVIINDTGTGQCGVSVPANVFNQATSQHTNSQLNITNNSIW